MMRKCKNYRSREKGREHAHRFRMLLSLMLVLACGLAFTPVYGEDLVVADGGDAGDNAKAEITGGVTKDENSV
ncbi:MAG: hypothetical protein LBV40_01530 [Methanomicrobiales archaeon]|nr:hypothetical protein [Methanomicrobiales archaeon]